MIQHNIKQSVRGMMRNKTFTFLNITGFSVGFAVCLIIAIFAYKEYTVDSDFKNKDNIYRLVDVEHQSVAIDKVVISDLKKISGVQLAVPVMFSNFEDEDTQEFLLDTESGKSIETLGAFTATNNDFFKLFGIKTIVSRAPQPLANTKSIVLTKSVAEKLYGTTDVLDKVIKKDDALFTVSAVVEDMPQNSSIKSEFFISDQHPDYPLSVSWRDNKKYYPRDIYLLLATNTDRNQLTQNLNTNFPKNTSATKQVALQTLSDIYLSKPLDNDRTKKGSKPLIFVFLAIALLTLIMSIFNYANFMISRQMATLKNSGIRITNGAMRSQIRAYYLTEVAIAVTTAFALAWLIAQIAMPFAERLLGTTLGLHWLLQPKLFAIIAILFVVVVFLATIAPIAFISRLQVQTLFGKTNIKSRKHPIKKVMNTMQLAISIVLLIAVFVISKQLHYVKSTDVGFKTSHLLRLNIPWDYEKYDIMKSEFAKLPFVQHLSLSSNTPGAGWSTIEKKNKDGKPVNINMIGVDKDFLKTFGMQLKEGREFIDGDERKALYFTEYTKKIMGWENLEDIDFQIPNVKIIAVVNNIYYNSLHSKMAPVAFYYSKDYFGGLNLRLSAGNLSEQMAAIEKTWKQTLGNAPFSFNFFDQYFDSLYKKEEKQAQALTLFSLIAFIITCLGLFAQILQTTQNRIKEIGIRKINGASIKEVMLLLNKEFILTVVVAFVIATPIAYYAMNKWLESFAYKTTLSWWVFALAGLSALVIALLTVSWQSWRTANRNPVEALRYE